MLYLYGVPRVLDVNLAPAPAAAAAARYGYRPGQRPPPAPLHRVAAIAFTSWLSLAPVIICIVRTVIESHGTSLCVKATIAAL